MNPFLWPRWLSIILAIAGLLLSAACLWSVESQRQEQKMYMLKHPDKQVERDICVGYLRVHAKHTGEIIALDNHDNLFRLIVNPGELQIGERYSFRGRLQPDGRIRVEAHQHHPHRLLKYLFSGLSLVLVLYILKTYIRIRPLSFYLYVTNRDKGIFKTGDRGVSDA